MKKITIAALALLGWASASAQYISTTEVGNAKGWTAFTADPVSKMAGYDDATVKIFNEDFSVYKTFTLGLSSNESISQMDQIVVTQHLFNTDDLYEVVVYNGEEWEVYNENSEMLGTIPSPMLMRVGEKNYIYTYDNGEYTLYALESRTNSLVSVRKLEGVRVFPNPANAGEMVRFQLPEGAIADIDIYNAAGQQELRVVGGEGTLELPANNLGNGVHPFKVTDNEGNAHSGKLIVK
ncbi:MAG: T9SS type A sorting domain-containing protein [Muribaculaceae bacterium]|nr:T9SS type A sorting domain-containing protein [Muribaculaceae bacterium]